MLVGSFGMNLNATVAMVPLLICTIAAVLLALVLEFFAFGGDYSRAERLEYEDDEYFYYVKAVPKASVATSERSIKKINAEPVREERVRIRCTRRITATKATTAIHIPQFCTRPSAMICSLSVISRSGFTRIVDCDLKKRIK